MDHPAALHRLKVGVPATVEHSSEAGPETSKWVAETTQVRSALPFLLDTFPNLFAFVDIIELYHFYGRFETGAARQGSAASDIARACDGLC